MALGAAFMCERTVFLWAVSQEGLARMLTVCRARQASERQNDDVAVLPVQGDATFAMAGCILNVVSLNWSLSALMSDHSVRATANHLTVALSMVFTF